jgi:hypothetical protein
VTEEEVRERAVAVCGALIAGNVDQVIGTLSDELRRNLGEVLALLPLPASEAAIGSVQVAGGGASYVVILDVTGEAEQVEIQTRWKDRNGEPRIVEVSHLSRIERPAEAIPGEEAEETGEAPA